MAAVTHLHYYVHTYILCYCIYIHTYTRTMLLYIHILRCCTYTYYLCYCTYIHIVTCICKILCTYAVSKSQNAPLIHGPAACWELSPDPLLLVSLACQQA
ncbi:hypothetical protein F4781DRAFT_407950 [Annulohypoxylon bovei var. microspora]|nr:hypothetical protein F4781DRAFT_407950 [Annulohypoxylon bovei var. microspora]